MNYLGLDYGVQHVGVALSAGQLAEPLTTIPNSHLLTRLKQLIATHKIHTVVIGLPEGSLVTEIKHLGSLLTTLNINVEYADETLSTRDAINSLLHLGKKKRSDRQHSAAAAIILQTWLDARIA